MEPSIFFLPDWPPALSPLLWIALAVVSAALAGEWVRHHLGLPRITAYPLVGMLVAAIAGDRLVAEHNEWLNRGLDVALAILLFELGSRVDLRWLRHNRWLLVTSICESLAASQAGWRSHALESNMPLAAQRERRVRPVRPSPWRRCSGPCQLLGRCASQHDAEPR